MYAALVGRRFCDATPSLGGTTGAGGGDGGGRAGVRVRGRLPPCRARGRHHHLRRRHDSPPRQHGAVPRRGRGWWRPAPGAPASHDVVGHEHLRSYRGAGFALGETERHGHTHHSRRELHRRRQRAYTGPAPQGPAVKCFQCGADVAPGARFCGHCGTLVGDPHDTTLVVPTDSGDDLLQRLRMVLAGEYEVEHELARGGMAVVFKATEIGLRRVVALKVLPPELGLTARAAERFKREARMVAEIDHPNIIPVYRVGQIGGILFFVMKFIEGKSLDAILQEQGALSVPVTLYVLRAAARALAYAHACGIVHRDVKGANILVDSDGRVMVSDFGVALRSSDVTLTADGTVIGTPPFMSPEQCAGRRAGPQSDQYSLGIVAFQMLAGSVPFHADTLAGVMHHHFFTPVPDLTLVRDDLPAHLLDVVRRALNKDADRRFKTTREMLTAIEATAFSERDRQKSERTLQHLVQGRAVRRITTRALPPLAEMPTLAMAALPAIPARRWRLTSSIRLAVLTAVGLVAVGAAWLLGRPSGAPAPARGASSDAAGPAGAARPPTAIPPVAPAPRRAAVPTGRLRLLTTPTTASIWIDGRRVGTGSVYDDVPIPPGARHLEVRAPGYETFDTTVVIEAGGTLSLKRVTLRSRGAG